MLELRPASHRKPSRLSVNHRHSGGVANGVPNRRRTCVYWGDTPGCVAAASPGTVTPERTCKAVLTCRPVPMRLSGSNPFVFSTYKIIRIKLSLESAVTEKSSTRTLSANHHFLSGHKLSHLESYSCSELKDNCPGMIFLQKKVGGTPALTYCFNFL